jgi:hypothetical protein
MSQNNPIKDLLTYIILRMEDREALLYRTKLVKFLYLIDLDFYRIYRRTYTGLNWIRYNFGPYASELNTITNRMGLNIQEENIDFSSGQGIKYTISEDNIDDEHLLPVEVRSIVDRVINRWADEDLNSLLDYVYCETEPMNNIEYKQPLDFTRVKSNVRCTNTHNLELSEQEKSVIRRMVEGSPLLTDQVSLKRNDADVPSALISIEETPSMDQLNGHVESDGNTQLHMVEGKE